MGQLIFTTAMTVDGVMEGSDWFAAKGGHDAAGLAKLDEAEAALIGRRNFEGLRGYWSDQHGPWADRLNPMPKYVASRTLEGPLDWNATLLEGDLAESVAKLKDSLDGDLISWGCGDIARQLVEAGLVDELRFWIAPAAWGSGDRPKLEKVRLELIGSETFDSGVVLLRYRPLS